MKDSSYPRALVHFDGDAFFASVEQVMDYRLRGKPVVTGGERNAATSLSYEAKSLGLSRGMTLAEMRIRCPQVLVVPSDYTAYGIFAQRMYAIVRKYTPIVEEYSIDECFADITGLDTVRGESYESIALAIKSELEESLALTFGVGLAPTKTIAKGASKAHKPAGFTKVPMEFRSEFLAGIPIHDVWGLGGASGTHLQKQGIVTAYDFAEKSDDWLTANHFGKQYRDVWLELRGEYIKRLDQTETDIRNKSLMRTRTFSPPSGDRAFVFSQLSKNIEEACDKLRRRRMKARGMTFYLKTQDFTYHSVSCELSVPTAHPMELLRFVNDRFDEVYVSSVLYRATGVTLRGFVSEFAETPDLFGEMEEAKRYSGAMSASDKINTRYGRHTISLGSSMTALIHSEREVHKKRLGIQGRRMRMTLDRERSRKTLSIPYLGSTR